MIKLKLKSTNSQSGQVAIVILLIMVVMLTVGLSLASRTTQELFLSQQESESARVFNAAEVGVEDALSYDFDSITGTEQIPFSDTETVDQVSVSTTINPNDELETTLVEGAAVHIDLAEYSSTLEVDWARESDCDDMASLLVSIYYEDTISGVTEVVHEALGPNRVANCDDDTDPNYPFENDDFTVISVDDAPYSLTWSEDLSLSNSKWDNRTPLFARVRAVYRNTSIRVSGGSGFPTQFFTIRSAANTDVGEESRTIEVGRTLSGAPSFMDYSVYSGGQIYIDDVPTAPSIP